MSNLFSPENPLIRFLHHFFDLMLLNALFIITCIPFFTIGAATSAMYHMTLIMIEGEDPYIVKGYFHSFKENFKQATLLWIPLFLAGLFFAVDLYIIYQVIDPGYSYFQFPVWFFIFIIISLMIYAFPLLGNYQNTTKQVLKNAILLSISNFPTTIFIVVLHLGIMYVASLSAKSLVVVGSLALFFGFAGVAYFCSLFLARIFHKCEENEEF